MIYLHDWKGVLYTVEFWVPLNTDGYIKTSIWCEEVPINSYYEGKNWTYAVGLALRYIDDHLRRTQGN